MQLDELRLKIDTLDEQLLQLLNERAKVALQIGELKKSQKLPLYHPKRENSVIENVLSSNKGPLSSEHIQLVFTDIIKICKEIQLFRG